MILGSLSIARNMYIPTRSCILFAIYKFRW